MRRTSTNLISGCPESLNNAFMPRYRKIVCAGLAFWLLTAVPSWGHGSDTYNLLVKLFVEEYQSRYLRQVELDDSSWFAYPLDKRYASFEDIFYTYLFSLQFPQSAEFPSPRDVNLYEDRFGFIIYRKSKGEFNSFTAEKRLSSTSKSEFSLTIDAEETQDGLMVLDDPIHEYPVIGDERKDSCLVLFGVKKNKILLLSGKEKIIRLGYKCALVREPIVFEWRLPKEFPIGNPKYESGIWTVVRERYDTMPKPEHPQRKQAYYGPQTPGQ